MLKVVRIICFIHIASVTECANILAVFPAASISHQVVFRPIVNELVKRGHHVTVITPDPQYPKEQSPKNLTEIDVHDISYTLWKKIVEMEKGDGNVFTSILKSMYEIATAVLEEQIKSSEVQNLINNKKNKFDLLFVEASVRPSISFSYLYKVPVIEISSLGPFSETYLSSTGAPMNPLVYPITIRQRVNNLTFWEKISELYSEYSVLHMYTELENSENNILKRLFGRQIPDIGQLKKDVAMIFLNAHRLWDFNRPLPPNTLYIGGIHQKETQQLPEDLKSFLDSSQNGVIYMSFGTNVIPSLLPTEKIQKFTKVFSQLPYDILWKWDKDEIPGRSKNVRIYKWFPQSDLLKHPNVKLFITQGGLQSTDEAITAGVPLIGVPMIGDQWFNVEMYVKHKIGLQLSIETVTEDILFKAIETIIKNKSYRNNIIKLRNILYDQPQTPVQRAVWWTEHVLRHGNAEHLRTHAAHMHWTEYYALDLILIFLSIIIITLLSAILLIRMIVLKLKYVRDKIKIN